MRQIPFPRPSYKVYLTAAIITGLSIAFILTVFQPFGTDRFSHSNKIPILLGYGVVTFISIALYYWVSLYIYRARREDSWSIIHETIDLLVSMVIGLLMCYFYFLLVFGHQFHFDGMISFVMRAVSVSLLPVLSLFIYLFIQYKDLRRSHLSISHSDDRTVGPQMITLKGSAKDDLITTQENDIIYIRAEDNYVILHLNQANDKIGRHMIRITMKQIKAQLSTSIFFQCHRSHIININLIRSISGNKNGTKVAVVGIEKPIPVSRSKVDQIRELYPA